MLLVATNSKAPNLQFLLPALSGTALSTEAMILAIPISDKMIKDKKNS
jgi:hypothetical protein